MLIRQSNRVNFDKYEHTKTAIGTNSALLRSLLKDEGFWACDSCNKIRVAHIP